jgi:hypothetical protein
MSAKNRLALDRESPVLVKLTGRRLYFYYGVTPLLEKLQSYNGVVSLYYRALQVLADKSIELIEGVKGLVPFNVVAVDKKSKSVSLMWYHGFWELERPLLVYSIKINTVSKSVSIYTRKYARKYIEASGSWPWNYIHRKDLFVDGLEKLAVNPYSNGLSLAWDTSSRKDVWVELEWIPAIISVKAQSKDDVAKLYTLIEDIISRVKNVKKKAKIIIEISP